MHVPDGFLDTPTSMATGAVALVGVAVALPLARREVIDDLRAPMAGIVATVIFASQMVNFPVGAGTSGHLLGGALAAVLVGPATAFLCIAIVLVVQALLLADGGVTALGTNITLMGIVGVTIGWFVFRGVLALLPDRSSSVVAASAIGALVSVPGAAAAFALLFAIGGTVDVPFELLFTAMVGWHTVIGVGEAVISALIVGAIMATRPDLVYGARRRRVAAPREREAVYA